MANQPETASYAAGVYQLEIADSVDGGVGAKSNAPLLALASRTAYLKQHMDAMEAGTMVPPGFALLASPAFTGTPTAPTAAAGDNTTKLATTAFVQTTVNGTVAVDVAGAATTTLVQAQYGPAILRLTGAVTANKAVVFPNITGHWQVINATTGAFTITLKTAAGTGVVLTAGMSSNIYCDGTNVTLQQTDFTDIILRGAPITPTPALFDVTQKIATTEFVNLKGFSYNGFTTVSTSQTLPLSAVGGQIQATSSSNTTLTLPLASTVSLGSTLTINNPGTGTVTFTSTGADVIGSPNGPIVTGLQLKNGDSAVFVSGVGGWNLCAGSIALKYSNGVFTVSFASAGYQRLPSGLIIQWMPITATVVSNGFNYANLPIPFPTGNLAVLVSASNISQGVFGGEPSGLSQIRFTNSHSAPQSGTAFAIGY